MKTHPFQVSIKKHKTFKTIDIYFDGINSTNMFGNIFYFRVTVNLKQHNGLEINILQGKTDSVRDSSGRTAFTVDIPHPRKPIVRYLLSPTGGETKQVNIWKLSWHEHKLCGYFCGKMCLVQLQYDLYQYCCDCLRDSFWPLRI